MISCSQLHASSADPQPAPHAAVAPGTKELPVPSLQQPGAACKKTRGQHLLWERGAKRVRREKRVSSRSNVDTFQCPAAQYHWVSPCTVCPVTARECGPECGRAAQARSTNPPFWLRTGVPGRQAKGWAGPRTRAFRPPRAAKLLLCHLNRLVVSEPTVCGVSGTAPFLCLFPLHNISRLCCNSDEGSLDQSPHRSVARGVTVLGGPCGLSFVFLYL